MRVRATKAGFFHKLHQPGDEFVVVPASFSPTWMEKVKEPKEESEKPRRGRPRKAMETENGDGA